MGSLLLDRGVPLNRCLEELCVSDPNRVREIHDEYIAAGARVIETNTFGGNAVRLSQFGFEQRVAEINYAAAQLALEAARGRTVYVAGSVGPLGITRAQASERGIDRAAVFRDQTAALIESGVDILFFETFLELEEMELALQASAYTDCVIAAMFTCKADGRLKSGVLLADAFARCRSLGARIVGANCVDTSHVLQLLDNLPADGLLAVYPNAGNPDCSEGRNVYPTTPEHFAATARQMGARGARLIGGCCGTTPTHIAAAAKALRS
jgi:homocysteine S-methyltransferase